MVAPLQATEEDKMGVQARFQNRSHGLKILLQSFCRQVNYLPACYRAEAP